MKTKLKTELPPMTATGKRRLRKLIAFLRTLKPSQFDFSRVVREGKHNGHTCGTVCCAAGWMPTIFPRLVEWYFSKVSGLISIRKPGTRHGEMYNEMIQRTLGIGRDTARGLFGPWGQEDVHEKLPPCGSDATPKRVARMLERYIRLTETPAK